MHNQSKGVMTMRTVHCYECQRGYDKEHNSQCPYCGCQTTQEQAYDDWLSDAPDPDMPESEYDWGYEGDQ